jgi:hypothetical protein
LIEGAGHIIVTGRRIPAAGRSAAELAAELAALAARRDRVPPNVQIRATRPITVRIDAPEDVLAAGPRTVPEGIRLSRVFELLRPGPRFDPARVGLVREGRAQVHDLIEVAGGATVDDPGLRQGDVLALHARPRVGRRYWVLGSVPRPGRRDLDLGDDVATAIAGSSDARSVHLVRGWPDRPRILRIAPDAAEGLALETDDLVLVSDSPRSVLAERAALAALVMGLAGQEPVVLAASPEE